MGSAKMASDTSITFYGLPHLTGSIVQACVGGLDCGDYTVSEEGSVTVPFGSDAQGLMTPQYLVSLDGYEGEQATPIRLYVDDEQITIVVPVVVGVGYQSDGQILRPAARGDLARRTDAIGKVRRAHEFAVLLDNVGAISFGTDFSTIDAAEFKTADGETDLPSTTLYSGVYRGILTDEYGYDSMLCWRVDRPWPATVCAAGVYLVAEE
jgi:hypothetical protein